MKRRNMVWAQEMKNLAADIKVSHRDRTSRLNGIKRETREILGAADDYMQSVRGELKEMARELKEFLAKSEATRKKDFEARMGEIEAKIKEIKAETKAFIAKSEETRKADFRAIMREISADIEAIKRSVGELRKSTGGLMADYKAERKEAAGYWASLGRGKGPSTAEEEALKAEKKEKEEKAEKKEKEEKEEKEEK